jgi:hypothetical protein
MAKAGEQGGVGEQPVVALAIGVNEVGVDVAAR